MKLVGKRTCVHRFGQICGFHEVVWERSCGDQVKAPCRNSPWKLIYYYNNNTNVNFNPDPSDN